MKLAEIGYTMMCEQRSPKDLVDDLVRAERAGFDFSVISDHFHPWLEEQGHSGYAWSILGAAAQATERIPLMTYVACQIVRYHPAIVAQKAATMALLSDGVSRWEWAPGRTSASTCWGAAGHLPMFVTICSSRRSR
jgi:G6PDH family F420-dependent oxidoreductase